MTRTIILIGLTAALAACNSEDHTIVAGQTPSDDPSVAADTNFVLPAAIQSTKTYRCADNTIVHVDWLADGKSANIRLDKGGAASVVSPEAGKPMVAEGGYSLAGAAGGSPVKIGLPGKGTQSCKA